MKYAMFVVIDPDHTDADIEASPDLDAWFDYVKGKGAWVAAAELHPRDMARTVRVRTGELLVTDGPFTESKEWVAGFAILECANLDEAVEIASRNPMAYEGRLEVRPVLAMDGF